MNNFKAIKKNISTYLTVSLARTLILILLFYLLQVMYFLNVYFVILIFSDYLNLVI